MHRLAFFLIFIFCTTSVFFSQKVQQRPSRVPAKEIKKSNSPSQQNNTYSKYRNLGIGVGLTRSVVYLARNVKENNDATGLNFALVYDLSHLLRLSGEYTYYFPIDISPTWYNIQASSMEINAHIIARLRNSDSYFYPLFGLSYNSFSGVYTGINDYLNLNLLYTANQKVITNWVGLNVGTGYEYFFKPGSFFIDYKMRVGFTEGTNQLNIQDVCITAGLRFNLRVRSLRSIFIYRDTRSRYLLDKANSH